METPSSKEQQKKRMSPAMLNTLTALIGIATLAAGIGWLVYSWVVDLEVPYFAIPLVMTVPVIVAVAFRNCFE
jgi:Na+/glutamate symporter